MANHARTDTPVSARARADRRTKDLVKRLEPGEIAVINHSDVDLVAADSLVDAGVVAVVNAVASFTGRYPNVGPLQLVRHGIVLLDDVGIGVLERIAEGEVLTIDGDRLLIGHELIATGNRQDEADLTERIVDGRLPPSADAGGRARHRLPRRPAGPAPVGLHP
jgi:uncharacterized membrane-anchored protein